MKRFSFSHTALHRVIIFTILAAAIIGPLCGDELFLENGDHITGYILSMDEDHLVIQTSYGNLTVDRSKIVSGTFSAPIETPESGLEVELLFDNDIDVYGGADIIIQNNGVLAATGVDGISQSAIRTTGLGNYLEIGGSEALDAAEDLTLSFWILLQEASRLQYILSKWDISEGTTTAGKIAVGTQYSGLYIYLVDPKGMYHFNRFDDMIPVAEWTHIAVVFNKGLLSVYRDGLLSGEDTFDFTALKNDPSPLYIMTAKANTTSPWTQYNLNGSLDGLRIYTRALSQTEIEALAAEFN
ncbi:MAG: LamG domain-containing protein [Spirochaetales bacterium]|jgi:hypothetical protein|nr:LamG domain-containing protein [Spirochaetales bacterium]